MAIAGVARVVREGYPDPSAWDPASRYHDPDSDPRAPKWFMVDIEAVRAIEPPLAREQLKGEKALASMMLLRRGARLSVQPVTAAEWAHVLALAGLDEALG
jgi:predicted RNA-binding protein with PUA-like domain